MLEWITFSLELPGNCQCFTQSSCILSSSCMINTEFMNLLRNLSFNSITLSKYACTYTTICRTTGLDVNKHITDTKLCKGKTLLYVSFHYTEQNHEILRDESSKIFHYSINMYIWGFFLFFRG